MNLQPMYTASVTLTGFAGGPLTLGTIDSAIAVSLMPFFVGKKGDKGDQGEPGEMLWASANW